MHSTIAVHRHTRYMVGTNWSSTHTTWTHIVNCTNWSNTQSTNTHDTWWAPIGAAHTTPVPLLWCFYSILCSPYRTTLPSAEARKIRWAPIKVRRLTFGRGGADDGNLDELFLSAGRVCGPHEIVSFVSKVRVVDEERAVCKLEETLSIQRLSIPGPRDFRRWRSRGFAQEGGRLVGRGEDIWSSYIEHRGWGEGREGGGTL